MIDDANGLSLAANTPARRFPLVQIHGLIVAISSVLGWWLIVIASGDGPLHLVGFALLFAASSLFPALLVKAYVDRRPAIALYVIPVLAMLAWAFVRFVGMVVT